MGPEVFVDTAFLIALLRANDTHHHAARNLADSLAKEGPRLVTTDAVLLELGNFFARSSLRTKAIGWIGRVRADDGWTVERLEPALLNRAEERYRRFADKNWSLTDCVSMEVMRHRRIREVASTDRGFSQAGFYVLL